LVDEIIFAFLYHKACSETAGWKKRGIDGIKLFCRKRQEGADRKVS